MKRNNYNSHDAEFGFDYGPSEEEFNKRHKKALKDAEPSGKKKRKKRKPKEKINHFKGLGSGGSSKGPWPKIR
jgi:hypothetical protein